MIFSKPLANSLNQTVPYRGLGHPRKQWMDWKIYQHLKKDNINEFKPFVPFEIRWILLVPSVLKYRGATFERGECKGYLLVGFIKLPKATGVPAFSKIFETSMA
jgi:hypothetical protein